MPVVPFGVTTATFLAVRAAVDAIWKVALTVVELNGITFKTVMPVPETVTCVAPVRFVPVSVTISVLP